MKASITENILDILYILFACFLAYKIFYKTLKGHIWAYTYADCLPQFPQDSIENEFASEFSSLAAMMGKATTRQQMNRYFERIYELQEKYQGMVDNYTLGNGIDNLITIYQKKENELGLNVCLN